jgi:hypothetical protein
MKKSIDSNAITAKMYLEQAEVAMDNILDLMYEELRVAEAKGDNEEVSFIKEHISKIQSSKIRIDNIGDYISNLVGLSWEVYKGEIYKKKKDD